MIRKFATALAIPAIAVLATSAFAANMTKSGEVKSVDVAKHELVLSSGDTFQLNQSIKADQIKAGTKVAVHYETKDGKMIASKVQTEK